MIVGYGYRRCEEDLRAVGAERVYIDISKERTERADMMRDGGLREGDTLVVLSEMDLAGNGAAIAKWRRLVAEKGATLDVRTPEKPPARIGGRPPKLADDALTPEQDRQMRDLFLCDYLTSQHKVRRCSEVAGFEIGYDQLYYRYVTKARRQGQE